jgi:hypothetical protein
VRFFVREMHRMVVSHILISRVLVKKMGIRRGYMGDTA